MLTHYYHFKKSIKQIHTGPAGLYLDGFAAGLWEAGYSETTARLHIRAAQHLVYWAQQQHVLLAKIDDALVLVIFILKSNLFLANASPFNVHGLLCTL
jgi:hypothetical protein